MKSSFHPLRLICALSAVYALHTPLALAADLSFTPPSGGGFVIKSPGGAQERFRVQGPRLERGPHRQQPHLL